MRSLARLLVSLSLAVAAGTCVQETPEDCAADEFYAARGCDEPFEGTEVVPRGCYRPCEDDPASCPEGTTCVLAFVDPCYMADCDACGGELALCVP
ncbi:MAG: hypothetical protein KC468_38090 [Myxococcales bacterium]|nr:hypothetical protein [Myxococcales bacterium]